MHAFASRAKRVRALTCCRAWQEEEEEEEEGHRDSQRERSVLA